MVVNNIDKLINMCKGEVYISINEHRNCYESVEEFLKTYLNFDSDDICAEVVAECIRKDTLVQIMAFPDTPVASYKLCHYNVHDAIEQMITIIEEEK